VEGIPDTADLRELLFAWRQVMKLCADLPAYTTNVGCLTQIAMIIATGKRQGEQDVEQRAIDDLLLVVDLLERESSEIVLPPRIVGPNGEHLA
jgi:hypothetical protein